MLFHLISVFAAGIMTGLCTYLVSRFIKGFPKFLVPVMAGIGMIAYGAWSEYSWAARIQGELPAHLKVGKEYASASYFSPWTFVFPRTDRMTLIDVTKIRTNEKFPGIVIAELILLHRYNRTGQVYQLFDCNGLRQADIHSKSTEENFISSAQWRKVNKKDGVLRLVCDYKRS